MPWGKTNMWFSEGLFYGLIVKLAGGCFGEKLLQIPMVDITPTF